jgi:hypothetical protein
MEDISLFLIWAAFFQDLLQQVCSKLPSSPFMLGARFCSIEAWVDQPHVDLQWMMHFTLSKAAQTTSYYAVETLALY